MLKWYVSGQGTPRNMMYNPSEMTSPYPTRAISGTCTTNGSAILTEGARTPTQWKFSGFALNRAHFLELEALFCTNNPERLLIRDHLGREITCVPISFEPVPRHNISYGHYFYHSYDVTVLVISVEWSELGTVNDYGVWQLEELEP